MRHFTLVLAVSAVLGLAALAVHAGSETAQPNAPVPDPALDDLAYFLGDWRCTGTISDPAGSRSTFEAQAKVRKEVDGSWLGLDYQIAATSENAFPARTIGHLGYCSQRGFTFILVGRQSYFVEHSPGWVGNAFTLDGSVQTEAGVAKSRDSFIRTSDSQFTHTVEIERPLYGWTRITDENCTRQSTAN